jgi:hypothetical protein
LIFIYKVIAIIIKHTGVVASTPDTGLCSVQSQIRFGHFLDTDDKRPPVQLQSVVKERTKNSGEQNIFEIAH